jgi:CRP-like cAMP-binding protein
MADTTDRVRRALDDNDVFGALPETDLVRLIAYGSTRRYATGETIFQRGEAGECMMIVLSGRVKIANYSADGKEAVLNFIEPGQVFGEIALLDGRARTADAIAIEPTELFELYRRELLPFLEDHPGAAIRLIEVLCEKLRHTTRIVEDIMFLNMAPRIARGLLRLAEEHGRRRGGRTRIDFKLSQRDLGGYVGLARENINRQLRAWRSQGHVTVEEGYITILDEQALRRIAEDRE